MGIFSSLVELGSITKDIQKRSNTAGRIADLQSKMNQVNGSMASIQQHQLAAADPASFARRISATATITSAGLTGLQVGLSSVVELQLLVMLPGGVPVPVSQSVMVTQLNMARVQVGAQLPVTLDPQLPATTEIQWN